MKQEEKVKTYFKEKADEFDNIYENKGNFIDKSANFLFRKGMKERFFLTMKLCGYKKNKRILDIGCGAGRFAIPLAKRGMKVIGIDYSEEMIIMAKELLKKYENNKSLDLDYYCVDFLKDFNRLGKFDISLAIGVFDYLNDPLDFLIKMKKVTKEKMIISFPKKITFQMPIRKAWLSLRKCPVYFYTRGNIKKLCSQADIKDYKIISHSAGYILCVNLH